MNINEVAFFLETVAPPFLQENYDNVGLLTGNATIPCTGVLISLDCTESIVEEAIEKKCNLIVAHHPIIFSGLKKINGKNYIERTIIKAIKNDIAIYAIHTNLDNVLHGVNGKMASKLGLENVQILAPKKNLLQKLVVFVPKQNEEQLRNALFSAGAGNIGNFSECSFTTEGIGSFTPMTSATPQTGKIGRKEIVKEAKIEVIFPTWMREQIIDAMKANHPYEEVAHDIYDLANAYQQTGAGVIGNLPTEMSEVEFLQQIGTVFTQKLVKHTALTGKKVKKIVLCGGAGSFLINTAKAAGADAYVTSDLKYHEFFDADGQLLLADIGHFESEQFTIDLLFELLSEKFPNFALLKTSVNTNPVEYFVCK
jgi:dinuclear metal center YbgI/SA1388 family protein